MVEKYRYKLQTEIFDLRQEINEEKNLLKYTEKNDLLNLLKNYENWTNTINSKFTEIQINEQIDKFENEIFYFKQRKKNLKLFNTLQDKIEEYIFFIRNFDFNNSEILIESTKSENNRIFKAKVTCLNLLKKFKNLQNNFNLELLTEIDIENDMKIIEENINYLKNLLAEFNDRSFQSF